MDRAFAHAAACRFHWTHPFRRWQPMIELAAPGRALDLRIGVLNVLGSLGVLRAAVRRKNTFAASCLSENHELPTT